MDGRRVGMLHVRAAFPTLTFVQVLHITVHAAGSLRASSHQPPVNDYRLPEAQQVPAQFLAALGGPTLEKADTVRRPWPRVKAYFINLDASAQRAHCMGAQLARMEKEIMKFGGSFEYERLAAVSFTSCTNAEECMEERPECFPTKAHGFVRVHGNRGRAHQEMTPDAANETHLLHGVFGNWCSHLIALRRMQQESSRFDYFMVMEDDVIMANFELSQSVVKLLGTFPNHWALIAVDTFNNPGERIPEQDSINVDGFPLHAISRTYGTYWGAHLWLLNARPLDRFVEFYETSPAVPVDWITKVRHPLHLGIWSYQPHQALQHGRALIPKIALCEDPSIGKSTIADLHRQSDVHLALDIQHRTLQRIRGSGIPPPTGYSLVTAISGRVLPPVLEVPPAAIDAAVPGLTLVHHDQPNDAPSKFPTPAQRGIDIEFEVEATKKWLVSAVEKSGLVDEFSEGKPARYRDLHIFGMYHSGARFAARMFNQILPPAMAEVECGSRLLVNNDTCIKGWRQVLHPMHPNTAADENFKGDQDAVAIVVVRHPFSLLRSIQRRPITNLNCGRASMQHPCELQDTPQRVLDYERSEDICRHADANNPVCWESLPKAWDAFAAGFDVLRSKYHRVLEVRYEDLVEYPRSVLDRVAKSIGIKEPEDCSMDVPVPGFTVGTFFQNSQQDSIRDCQKMCEGNLACKSIIFTGTTGECFLLPRTHIKQHENTVVLNAETSSMFQTVVSSKVCQAGRSRLVMDYAVDSAKRDQLRIHDYASRYDNQEMNEICDQINKTRLFTYGYHGCQDVWPGFDELIFHGSDWQGQHDRNLLKQVPNWNNFEGLSPMRVDPTDLADRLKRQQWRIAHHRVQVSKDGAVPAPRQ